MRAAKPEVELWHRIPSNQEIFTLSRHIALTQTLADIVPGPEWNKKTYVKLANKTDPAIFLFTKFKINLPLVNLRWAEICLLPETENQIQ